MVALRKESVDRNVIRITTIDGIIESLSARRAWIEMCPGKIWSTALAVALRKESVDRNGLGICHYRDDFAESLSARRAWIEIILSR